MCKDNDFPMIVQREVGLLSTLYVYVWNLPVHKHKNTVPKLAYHGRDTLVTQLRYACDTAEIRSYHGRDTQKTTGLDRESATM